MNDIYPGFDPSASESFKVQKQVRVFSVMNKVVIY